MGWNYVLILKLGHDQRPTGWFVSIFFIPLDSVINLCSLHSIDIGQWCILIGNLFVPSLSAVSPLELLYDLWDHIKHYLLSLCCFGFHTSPSKCSELAINPHTPWQNSIISVLLKYTNGSYLTFSRFFLWIQPIKCKGIQWMCCTLSQGALNVNFLLVVTIIMKTVLVEAISWVVELWK